MDDAEIRHKLFMRECYSQRWPQRREEYGFTEFERAVCAFVASRMHPETNMLDVGSGTGWPHAVYFYSLGHGVVCLDITENFLPSCPSPVLGDAEILPFRDNSFGCVYCFNSTWLFQNPLAAIAEMLRVSSDTVVFDANNSQNGEISKSRDDRWVKFSYIVESVQPDGTAKKVAEIDMPVHHYENPADPSDIARALSGMDCEVYAKEGDELWPVDGGAVPSSVKRLVYAVRKGGKVI